MNFRIEVICMRDDETEERREVLTVTKEQLAMDTLGLTVAEGKTLLASVQTVVVEEQTVAYLAQRRSCATCGKPYRSKEPRRRTVHTVFGAVSVPHPRWHRCTCQTTRPLTFRPTAQWLTGQTSPELLYLETKWASLIPYAKVVDLLQDVLPVTETLNAETARQHLHATATKMEQALGEEQECLFAGTDDDWAAQSTPDGPMTVGIDGGFVRARHKGGFFEVIAGKSIVAFRRNEAEDIPLAKRFGFVQTYDTKPRRRLWELLKSQGMQENQAVLFLSDGGETVRQLQTYLHPCSTHVIDWFHIAMKLTVLHQQNKAFIQVVSKRFVKRQQMQWTQKGAHLLLQTRVKVLDVDLEEVFWGWYPQFRSVPVASPTP